MARFLMFQFQDLSYIGVAYLCGAIGTAGHQFKVVLAEAQSTENIISEIDSFCPDILGFTCITGLHKEALELAGTLKKEGITLPMLFGGAHPTLFSKSMICMPEVDGISLGEGEVTLVNLLDSLDEAKGTCNSMKGWPLETTNSILIHPAYLNLRGFIFKIVEDGKERIITNEIAHLVPLDELPPCDWSCYEGTKAVRASSAGVMPIRGCPYNCTYCFNHNYKKMYRCKGKYIRHHSPERSIMEIKQALAAYPSSGLVYIYADTMGLDIQWTKDFFDLYNKEIDKKFILLAHPDLVTQTFVDILAATQRCHLVSVGMESGSKRVRCEILNRKYSNDSLIEMAKRLHDAKIKIRTFSLIALPTESEEEIWETINLDIAMKSDFPRAAQVLPFPGTKLAELAVDLGYMDEITIDNFPSYNLLAPTMLNKKFNVDRMQMYFFMYQTAVLFPKLHPFIRKFISMKPNWIFRTWFKILYGFLQYKAEGRNPLNYIMFVWSYRKHLK